PDGNNSSQRPDRVADVSPTPANQNPNQWINIAAFAVPVRGTWGNAGRNIVRAPGLFQIDLALQKSFSIGSSRTIAFRCEAFNAFNRVNLGTPGTNISSSASFGRITGPLNSGYGTGTARQIQFMFRLNY
ncbi:MAG: TonB-dependent receptor, partial [Acidobacteria bacterium]|nr:TonB-dependent receptor [Acidobacteriota bacterium]